MHWQLATVENNFCLAKIGNTVSETILRTGPDDDDDSDDVDDDDDIDDDDDGFEPDATNSRA